MCYECINFVRVPTAIGFGRTFNGWNGNDIDQMAHTRYLSNCLMYLNRVTIEKLRA